MFGKTFPRQEPRKVIQPRTLNGPIAEVERLSRLAFSAPIEVSSAFGAPQGSFAMMPMGRPAVVGGSNIAARSSNTPGSGSVNLYSFDGTVLVAAEAVTAYNWSSSAIVAGKYVWMHMFNDAWFITAVDC